MNFSFLLRSFRLKINIVSTKIFDFDLRRRNFHLTFVSNWGEIMSFSSDDFYRQDSISTSQNFLNVSNLRSERSDSVTSSTQCQLSVTTLPMIQFEKSTFKDKCVRWKTKNNWKNWFISLLVVSLIIGSAIFIVFLRTHFISSSGHLKSNETTSFVTFQLPNNCTYSKIDPFFSWNDSPSFNYTFYSKIYKAMTDRAMLTFALRHDPFYWCLDEISIKEIDTNRELVKNGDFESFSSTSSFIRCRSATSSSTNLFSTSLHPHSGNQSFCDGTVRTASYLSQKIEMQIGKMYHLSFWLRNLGEMPNNALVFISYD